MKIMVVMGEYLIGGRERRRQAVLKCESSGNDLYCYGHSHVPWFFESDSAVEGEAQDKAQAFRSERNGPVPLSTVAGIWCDERRPQPLRTKCQLTRKL
jgi:hypothetical protein